MSKFDICSKRMSNGVTVVNCTPHALTFLDGEDVVIVPSSVPEGARTGFAVISAKSVEKVVGDGLVKTEFLPSEDGAAIIAEIKKDFAGAEKLRIVGSIIAANAFRDVVGMVPAPGFERMPPAEKKMSVDKFNVGNLF